MQRDKVGKDFEDRVYFYQIKRWTLSNYILSLKNFMNVLPDWNKISWNLDHVSHYF